MISSGTRQLSISVVVAFIVWTCAYAQPGDTILLDSGPLPEEPVPARSVGLGEVRLASGDDGNLYLANKVGLFAREFDRIATIEPDGTLRALPQPVALNEELGSNLWSSISDFHNSPLGYLVVQARNLWRVEYDGTVTPITGRSGDRPQTSVASEFAFEDLVSIAVDDDGLIYALEMNSGEGGGTLFSIDPVADAFEPLFAIAEVMPGDAPALAVLPNGNVVLGRGFFDGTPARLEMLNRSGDLLKTVTLDSDVFGNVTVFGNPTRMIPLGQEALLVSFRQATVKVDFSSNATPEILLATDFLAPGFDPGLEFTRETFRESQERNETSVKRIDDIAIDPDGRIVFFDGLYQRVRRVDAESRIAPVGGGLEISDCSIFGQTTQIVPTTLAIDSLQRLYLGDRDDNVIWRLDTNTGTVTTFAGIPGVSAFAELDLAGKDPRDEPIGLVQGMLVDRGDVFFYDDGSISLIRPTIGQIESLGRGFSGFGIDDLTGNLLTAREVVIDGTPVTELATLNRDTGESTPIRQFEPAFFPWHSRLVSIDRRIFVATGILDSGESVPGVYELHIESGAIERILGGTVLGPESIPVPGTTVSADSIRLSGPFNSIRANGSGGLTVASRFDGIYLDLDLNTGLVSVTASAGPINDFVVAENGTRYEIRDLDQANPTIQIVGIDVSDSVIPQPASVDSGDAFGTSVAGSGTRFAVGIPSDESERGSGTVAVYFNDGCIFTLEDQIDVPEGFVAAEFGSAVALDGDIMVVASDPLATAKLAKSKGGLQELRAGIFERVGSTWQFRKPAPIPVDEPEFGRSIAIEGDTVYVGSPTDSAGSVHVFQFDGQNLLAQDTLLSNRGNGQTPGFGSAIAATDGKLAIASAGNLAPSVELLERVGSNLQMVGVATPQAPTGGFGAAISIDGLTIAVGAPEEADGRGLVHVFDFSASAVLEDIVRNPDGSSGDQFGSSVQLLQSQVFIGAPGFNNSRGAVFKVNLANLAQKRIKPSASVSKDTPAALRRLGASLVVLEDRLVSGAPETELARGDALVEEFVVFSAGFEARR